MRKRAVLGTIHYGGSRARPRTEKEEEEKEEEEEEEEEEEIPWTAFGREGGNNTGVSIENDLVPKI